jgi:hypothetical protein
MGAYMNKKSYPRLLTLMVGNLVFGLANLAGFFIDGNQLYLVAGLLGIVVAGVLFLVYIKQKQPNKASR